MCGVPRRGAAPCTEHERTATVSILSVPCHQGDAPKLEEKLAEILPPKKV
jgi:hypothetical protein